MADNDRPRGEGERGPEQPGWFAPATEQPAANTLTLEFGRYLTVEEFRTVVDQVKAHVPHVQHLRADAVPLVVVRVGDQIRFGTSLLRQIDDGPNQESQLVELERIVREPDGTLTLWLKRAESAF